MSTELTTPADRSTVARGRDFSVADRVAIVTGAGQGIGREYAKQFAAAGAIPVLADINEAAANNVAGEIEAAGGSCLVVPTDLGERDSVQAMADTVLERYGRVDVLVNNAAIFTTLKKLDMDDIPLDEWDRVIRVNVTGSYLTARAVVGSMREARFGRIINISSGSVFQGTPRYLHYVSSKAALVGMTRAMARELGEYGITVNCVQPGGTFTEVPRETITEEGKKLLIQLQSIHREEVPMDLVGLVIFLSSPAAEFITGQTIAVDGGLTNR
jgi:NAD(P)-dependent dehydrogenase (short-subunit alcohol dehydrogenase family)